MRKRELKQSDSATANLLSIMLDRHPEFSQREIAGALGFRSGSVGTILTQMKNGRTKVPISHIMTLCKFLGEDPRSLLATALNEYQPEILKALIETGDLNQEFLSLVRHDADEELAKTIKRQNNIRKISYS